MLIFAVNRRLNIHDFRMRTSVSILPVDFRFQSGNPYTRFSKKASHVQSLLLGQGDVFILVRFSWDAYAERLFLFAHPIRLPLSIYISVPPHANKKIDNFFFACGCRAGILFDFQMIIERGPEIFTGEPGEIIVDSLQSPVMLTVKKHIQYFYHQTILDRNVGQRRRRGGNGVLFLRCCPSGSCLNPVDEWIVTEKPRKVTMCRSETLKTGKPYAIIS